MKLIITIALLMFSITSVAGDFYRQQCGEDFISKITFNNGIVWIKKTKTSAIAHYVDKTKVKYNIISYKIELDQEMTEGFISFTYLVPPSFIFSFHKAEPSNPYELCLGYEDMSSLPLFPDDMAKTIEQLDALPNPEHR